MNRFARAAAPALIILSLGGYAASNAQQAPSTGGRVNPTLLEGGTYRADPAHSMVGWRVNHFGFNDYLGIFGDLQGTLRLDPDAPGKAHVDVTIPITSVVVASTGLRSHLLRPGKNGGEPDFFGPTPEPARFVSTEVQVSPGGLTADVLGRLTINGITKPVTLKMRFTGAGANPVSKVETVGFEGHATIKRSDFGIDFGIPLVSDDVALELTAAFEAAGARPDEAPRDTCGATAASETIGRKDTPSLRAEVVRKVGHNRIRWLPPGSIVTQDLRSDRLNVDIDEGGVVTRVRCS
ncbi:MAG TPA: I78 family peptidase inhibitor [Qipengyuania sp.]|nr:I78 family peptidase inhibitor [Qipengyuania sp.]